MNRFATALSLDPQAIARLTDEVSKFLGDAEVDARACHHVALVIEEILTNVLDHGGNPDTKASVAIEVQPDQVSGQIVDQGRPFDPRSAPSPDLQAPAEDRKIGGLGLHLVQELTSALDYRHDGSRNWTLFCVPRSKAKG